jgi:hypothetical protein
MAQAANMVAIRWADGVEADLDAERRRLTLQALGRSVLGLDLDVHEPPATTSYQLAREVLQACRPDPRRDAPLERALIKTTDPSTGLALSDEEICNELHHPQPFLWQRSHHSLLTSAENFGGSAVDEIRMCYDWYMRPSPTDSSDIIPGNGRITSLGIMRCKGAQGC